MEYVSGTATGRPHHGSAAAPSGGPVPPPQLPPPRRPASDRRGGGRRRGAGGRRKDPLWAKLLVIVGALLMLGSGVVVVGQKLVFNAATSGFNRADLLDPGAQQAQHVTISGPKNILLVGLDNRPDQDPTELIRSDSIIVLHIAATHDRAYLVSIPRDTFVDIPAYANGKSSYRGGKDKINAAFAFGGQGLTGVPGRQSGFRLLEQTIKKNWNLDFQAGAIVDFTGFQKVVEVLGGVDMCVDEETASIHIGTNKTTGKFETPYWIDEATRAHLKPDAKPKVYPVGCYHMAPWEALDYVRQRETLPDGDYGRTRHQQQFIKAVFRGMLTGNVLRNPGKLKNVLTVVGNAMTIDSGRIPLEDWVFAMQGIDWKSVLTVKTNAGQFYEPDGVHEALNPTSLQLLDAVRTDSVDTFVQQHTDWVSN